MLIAIGPSLKVIRELVVRYDVDRSESGNIGESVQPPFNDRFARDLEQWLSLLERQWIKPGRITCGENDDVHKVRDDKQGSEMSEEDSIMSTIQRSIPLSAA